MPTTVRPAFAASVARCSPPGPSPMTTRSTAVSVLMGPAKHAGCGGAPRGPRGRRRPGWSRPCRCGRPRAGPWSVEQFGATARGDLLLTDARTVRLPPARAAARAGQQADPVRRRRAELHRQGVGRRRRRHRALGADVPRRLRGRRAEPGRHDPLRGAQRAGRRPRRAHLRRVARPRGADARARGAAVHRRRAPPGRRLRPVRPVLLHRARLHQHAHRARPGRHPAARRRPRRRATRSSSPAATPRSTPSRSPTSSTPPWSATARRPCSRSPTSSAPGSARGCRVAAARCCCAWPAPAGSTCRRSTTSSYLPDGRIQRIVPSPDAPGVPWRVAKHTVMDLDAWPYPKQPLVPLAETVHERMSVEIFRGCTRGCRFCQAGMITRPVRERSITGIGEMVERGLAATGFEEVGLLSLSSSPTTPRSPTSPRAWPTATRAPTPGCRCRRPASTRSTSTSPTS